jgi:predicted dienelactone hydrolase
MNNSSAKPLKSLTRRMLKILAGFAMAGALAVAGLLVALWLEHRTEITLPAPTGPFAVGRAIYDWTDDATMDPLAPTPGTKHELLVWIWFPAERGASVAAEDYLPKASRLAVERHSLLLNRLMTRELSKVHGHTLRNAEVSPQQQSYPVTILRAGGSLEVWNYTTLAEDLASHGYIVAGLDSPYRTFTVAFPDGRVMIRTPENNPELFSGEELERRGNKLLAAGTGDIGFALNQLARLNASDPTGKFTGRLDMARLGIFGHSFGGAQAAQFCSQDSRCKAGIDIDGSLHGSVIQSGMRQPFMFLGSSQGDFSSDAEVRQIVADLHSVYDRLPADKRLWVSIRGANHFTFTDDGALFKSGILRWAFHLLGKLDIDGRRQLAVTAYCVRSFFDAHLKETRNSRLEISSPLYPEIEILQ